MQTRDWTRLVRIGLTIQLGIVITANSNEPDCMYREYSKVLSTLTVTRTQVESTLYSGEGMNRATCTRCPTRTDIP